MENRSFARTSNVPRLCAGIVVALCLAFVSGLALAGGSGVYVPQLGATIPAEKAAAVQHSFPSGAAESATRAPRPTVQHLGIPARLLGPDVPVPISPALLRTTNGWLVSDGATLVAVYAGASGNDSSRGRLVIVRQSLVKGIQTQDVVDAGKTGALTIDDAPAGAAVETSAQHGDIGFRGAGDARGVLHLARDTVEVR